MNQTISVGILAKFLESLSREQVWFLIVLATAGIGFADYAVPGVGFTPLYMLVVCAACWGLGAREGYFVAIVAAFLALLPSFHADVPPAPHLMVLRVVVRIVAFLFIAATITSFRRAYNREMFHANRDRMTGTLNKEVFHRRCAAAIEGAARARQALLLIILDLDDFKEINNREGHRAGDAVLRLFARGVASIMRREDLIGRIGGDEFALLVRVPSIGEGQGFARDIHARISSMLTDSPYPVTCSMGALLIPPDANRNPGELMHAADEAMYRAKRGGKNSVEIARADEHDANSSRTLMGNPIARSA